MRPEGDAELPDEGLPDEIRTEVEEEKQEEEEESNEGDTDNE
jgi:hypothetical protein